MVFQWSLRVLMFITVSYGFVTIAYWTKKNRSNAVQYFETKDENTLRKVKGLNNLLVAIWSFVLLMAAATLAEMIATLSCARIVCASVEALAWIVMIILTLRK